MPGLPRGTRVAGYRIEEQIADGVYRAVQLALDRPVALKEVAGDDRSLRAWRLAAAIDHPHVVPVVETVAHDGRFYVAMRLAEGGDLAGASLGRGRAAALMEQAAGALGAAHATGLVHGDLKPEKVLLSADREHAYLTGFHGTGSPDSDLAALDDVRRFVGAGPPEPMPEPTRGEARRIGLMVIAAATLLTIIGAAVLSVALRSTSPDQPHDALDGTPSAKTVTVDDVPSGIAVGERRVWVTQSRAGAVVRLDPQEGTKRDRPVRVGPDPVGVAVGGGYVWVVGSAQGSLSRVDPGEGEVRGQPIDIGEGATSVVYSHGSVWVADREADDIVKVDPGANEVERRIGVPGGVRGDLAVGEGSLWVPGDKGDTITRIDPAEGTVSGSPIRVGGGRAGAVAAGEGSLWVQDPRSATLLQVDVETGRVVARVTSAVGDRVVVGGGAVWLLDSAGGAVQRVDPEKAAVVGPPVPVEAGRGSGITVGENAAWVFSPVANVVTRVGF